MNLSRKLESWAREFDEMEYGGESFRLLAAEAAALEARVAELEKENAACRFLKDTLDREVL